MRTHARILVISLAFAAIAALVAAASLSHHNSFVPGGATGKSQGTSGRW